MKLLSIPTYCERLDLEPKNIETQIRLEWKDTKSDIYLNAHNFSDETLRFTLLLQLEPPKTIKTTQFEHQLKSEGTRSHKYRPTNWTNGNLPKTHNVLFQSLIVLRNYREQHKKDFCCVLSLVWRDIG